MYNAVVMGEDEFDSLTHCPEDYKCMPIPFKRLESGKYWQIFEAEGQVTGKRIVTRNKNKHYLPATIKNHPVKK